MSQPAALDRLSYDDAAALVRVAARRSQRGSLRPPSNGGFRGNALLALGAGTLSFVPRGAVGATTR
ncbi:MAG: hypothetical protein AAGD08_20705, partial [Pseudomonadota bacterium]